MSDKLKRPCKMSRKMRQAQGLPSSSEESVGSTDSDQSSNSKIQESRTTLLVPPSLSRATSTESLAPPLTRASSSSSLIPPLSRAPSTSSLASTAAVSVSAQSTNATENAKRAKFKARYKTASRTNEQVLEAQVNTWKSGVYKHFRMPPSIIVKGDDVVYDFVCISHPLKHVTRARHDESTGNLAHHIERCTPEDSKESRALAAYTSGSTYTPAKHRMKIALWIANRCRPFAIVEDEELLDIFRDLNPACKTRGRQTVSKDVREIFKMSRKQVALILQSYPGKLHIAADGWTSPNMIAFIGITVHWVDLQKAALKSTVLDFVKASKAHTGVYLAARIAENLREYGIDKKLMSFTADNAENNQTLTKELKVLIPTFGGVQYRVRCFAHILNLVVKAILSPFAHKLAKKATNESDTEEEEEDVVMEDTVVNTAIDKELNMLARELNSEGVGDEEPVVEEDTDDVAEDVEASDAQAVAEAVVAAEESLWLTPLSQGNVDVGRISIAKLRALAVKIVNSPTLREDLKSCCTEAKIDEKLMVRDVATRWNSTSELVQRGLQLRDALNILAVKAQHNKNRGVRLKRFHLQPAEWDIMQALSPLLDVFLLATNMISQNKIPLIHHVIPYFDSITTALEDNINNAAHPPIVRHAALRGFHMLNKYYGKSDESTVFRIAMILHPRQKTNYFHTQHWPQDWIDESERLARKVWIEQYKPATPSPAATAQPQQVGSSRFADASRYFSSILNDQASSSIDPMDDWLNSPTVNTSQDPITYWVGMQVSGHPLAVMALDFLSVPATSTDCERSFSQGGLTISRFRHSLSDASARAATVLGAWKDLDGAIPKNEIIEVFNAKAKRPKKKAKIVEPSKSQDEVVIIS